MPANWDLGEDAKIVLFAVTEGEDKPLKYPTMFQRASHVVMTKADLLPYVPFDIARAMENARTVNPALDFIELSGLTGINVEGWFDFLRSAVRAARPLV